MEDGLKEEDPSGRENSGDGCQGMGFLSTGPREQPGQEGPGEGGAYYDTLEDRSSKISFLFVGRVGI